MLKQFYFEQFSLSLNSFNDKNSSISNNQSFHITQFSFVWPIDRALSGATTPGQIRTGSDGNERVLRIPQNSSITWTSPSGCLMSYAGPSLVGGESYFSAEVQSMYSKAPVDWESKSSVTESCKTHC